MGERRGDWIQTYTGKQVYPLDPRWEEIDIIDIAHALSNMCRYTGHVSSFYSVAQHSVLVSQHCGPHRLWGLLHDASEAYLADIARPVKPHISGYKEAEERLMSVIAMKFGLPWPEPAAVKAIDTRILLDEKRALMNQHGARAWDLGVEPLGIDIVPMLPNAAEQAFLDRYYELESFGSAA